MPNSKEAFYSTTATGFSIIYTVKIVKEDLIYEKKCSQSWTFKNLHLVAIRHSQNYSCRFITYFIKMHNCDLAF